MKKYLIVLLYIGNFIFTTGAQQLQFNSLSVKDGLSQHDVSSIIQDSEGFIWIGTYDGLNRFDGYSAEHFFHTDNPSSLSSNRILSLFEDHKKRLWIGTDGYGLNYYSLADGAIKRISVPDNYKIINDITQNTEGDILVATNEGLFKITEKEQTFSYEILQTPITGFKVKKIKILKNGDIVYATNKGVWINHNNQYSLIKGSENTLFKTITETLTGQIWVGGVNGLFQIENNTLISRNDKFRKNILSIAEGTNNDIWVSTFDSGLLHIPLNSLEVNQINAVNSLNHKLLSNNPLTYVFKDSTNTLWVSNKNGVLYSNLDSEKFKSLPVVKKGHVRTLFATNNRVFYGYQADKFYTHYFDTNYSKPIILPEDAKPFKVDTLNGRVHLGTTKGLYREKVSKNNEFEIVPIFSDPILNRSMIITSFCKDMFGNQYFGTLQGLVYKTANYTGYIQEKFKKLKYLQNARVFALKVDRFNNCIWVGTISKGIFKLNLDNSGEIVLIENFNEQMVGSYNIPNNTIWCFFQKKDGTLYVGTDTGLLLKKPNQNKFKSVLVENIQNKKILAIVDDENSNLWLNNSQGLIKYSPETGLANKYNYFDGLLTNSFTEAISKNQNKQLFFGNISGINYFKSAEIKNNTFSSKIAFTGLLLNNKKVDVKEDLLGSILLNKRLNNTRDLSFNHKQNNFTVEFTSTNYSNAKVNAYRYKLEGYDAQWQVLNNTKRYASYSNIPSGNYTLFVEATNPDGKWSNETRTLQIEMLAAPWKTWWAYLFYLILFSTILFVIVDFWLNKQKLRNQIKLSNFKNEQEKEVNEMKLIFFTDVSHEFKTPLSLIIGPINDLIRGNISKDHKEFCYNIVSRNTNRMMHLVDQLLDFRKINSGINILKVSRNDLCFFVNETTKSFLWQAKNKEINFNVISPDSYFCHFDKDIIEKVIYNLLSNAFKYTPNKGTIEIEIKPTWKEELEYFVIVIRDSGKGISQLNKKKIFERHFHGKDRSSSGIGLHLTSTLIKKHKGEINVLNSSLGGTEFMITLPVSSKAFKEDEYLTKEDIPIDLPDSYIPGDIPEIILDGKSIKEKILIVEDDFDLRKYLIQVLKTYYIIFEASNGKEGLEVALKKTPDIIITDIMMPEMDGLEMCEKIKKNILISHIPVLMLTAKTDDKFYNKGLQAGAWDYIAKPFNSYQLLQKIKNIVATRNNFRQHINKGNLDTLQDHYVSYDQKFIKNIVDIIKIKMVETSFSVEDLSEEIGLSRMQLHRKLKALIGLSTTAFINSVRIEKAIDMFDNGCDRVQEAMDAVGINTYAHFSNLFKEKKGITPKKYIDDIKKGVT